MSARIGAHSNPSAEPRTSAQLSVILGKSNASSRHIPVAPEFHRQALSQRALTAMPWALQQLGDKNVSSFRRRPCTVVTKVPALPSSKMQSIRTEGVLTDEKSLSSQPFLDGEFGHRSGQPSPGATKRERKTNAKKAIQKAGQSLTAPIWNVSSPCPHRGKTGGSSEEDVSAAPKEPETHARFPEAHEHPIGARSD